MIIETLATPRPAAKLIEITDMLITHSVPTHYKALRVFGVSAYHAARAGCFKTVKSSVDALLRDGALARATQHTFARRLINSGRLA